LLKALRLGLGHKIYWIIHLSGPKNMLKRNLIIAIFIVAAVGGVYIWSTQSKNSTTQENATPSKNNEITAVSTVKQTSSTSSMKSSNTISTVSQQPFEFIGTPISQNTDITKTSEDEQLLNVNVNDSRVVNIIKKSPIVMSLANCHAKNIPVDHVYLFGGVTYDSSRGLYYCAVVRGEPDGGDQ
jgi:hypothetical protein